MLDIHAVWMGSESIKLEIGATEFQSLCMYLSFLKINMESHNMKTSALPLFDDMRNLFIKFMHERNKIKQEERKNLE